MIVLTCPGPTKPSTWIRPSLASGEPRIAVMAEGVRTWLQNTLKFWRPSSAACFTTTAVAGVVVSKPMAKKTTSRVGFSFARRSASELPYTMRMSAPPALAVRSVLRSRAGTRIMSPNVQSVTLGRWAIRMACSRRPIGRTHTGQPGPWIISTAGGSISTMP